MPAEARGHVRKLPSGLWQLRYYDRDGMRRSGGAFPSKSAALSHYRAALAIVPDAGTALNNVGHVLYEQGRWDDAIRHYTDALARPGCDTCGPRA